MKSILSRKFSRSLSSLVSRPHQDNTLSLPDYYRDTRREIYGPCWSDSEETYCSVRTMELPYFDDNESYRSSFLLDIGFPGDEGGETKATCYVDARPFAFKSCAEREAPSSTRKKFKRVGVFHRAVFRGFFSLFCGRSHL
ncbi:hypothetical protein AGABI1DRAFT_110979 [Agaricus bisporus var. burnettii JB137-S8]|uniref:Uncharacterized protein n=1 Tax=Agaricus bisporus var. burnettii (strain JB137-S8 / ATCC MYA-4627 / FGSC 10392) TaxID=597362 RepID=K5XGC7_AGABU|nr:uncharacterized protein AGABI1DRAFT_110979 [Agaricus bisporus var. burnettii JB137-S8]EKM82312.1 hypothetical protein AGABI1DRAFT_110979 [Agaricus bisporus var. burnettii JB137-S8]